MLYNVLDFGACGDGSTNDGAAIQRAVDLCHAHGGGRVYLPGGKTYVSGSVILKSHVELYLEAGAVLRGSADLADYTCLSEVKIDTSVKVPTYENCEYTGEPLQFFIYAKDESDISITGPGTIDGMEEIYYGTVTPWHIDGSFYPRIPLLFFENVEHLTIRNVTLQRSAFWTTHLVGCSDVLIDGVRILNNLRLANCDGIDPDHCKNVRIANCHIESADDCIVFKNTEKANAYGACENITVTNCTLMSTSAAIKFGTESENVFRNIIVSNCNISCSNRGISLQLRDKGSIENVIFCNLNIETRMFSKQHWWGAAEPVAITAVKRKKNSSIGTVSNVRFQNINCDSENGILIYGDESRNISDIMFENVRLKIRKKTEWPKEGHDLRPWPGEAVAEGKLAGYYCRNAERIQIRGGAVTVMEDMAEAVPEKYDIAECGKVDISENL